jgi:hypothetical protein
MTPAERMAIMWQLAVDAWSFKGKDIREAPMRRDLVRVVRLDAADPSE